MKAILKFNLPEDAQDYEYAINGKNLASVLVDYINFLRNDLKYNDKLDKNVVDGLEYAKKNLVEILKDYEIYRFVE